MREPPEPEMRNPATLPSDEAISQLTLRSNVEPTETVSQFQAASLRRRFALGYYFAATVAYLAFAGCPR